jgi:hypothetical protein
LLELIYISFEAGTADGDGSLDRPMETVEQAYALCHKRGFEVAHIRHTSSRLIAIWPIDEGREKFLADAEERTRKFLGENP